MSEIFPFFLFSFLVPFEHIDDFVFFSFSPSLAIFCSRYCFSHSTHLHIIRGMRRTPFTKTTVFKQKIATSDIVTYFPDYTGRPGDVQAGCEYFSHRFQALNQNSQKQVYVHLTCATGEF